MDKERTCLSPVLLKDSNAEEMETPFYSFSPRISSKNNTSIVDDKFFRNKNEYQELSKKPSLPKKSRMLYTSNSKYSNDTFKRNDTKIEQHGLKQGNNLKHSISMEQNLDTRKYFNSSKTSKLSKNANNKIPDYDEPLTPPRHIHEKPYQFLIPEKSVNTQYQSKTKLSEIL